MITLVAIACHLFSNMTLCEEVIVPTETMVAGKVDDPIPMTMTMGSCRAEGILEAQQWVAHQQQYAGWYVTTVKCVPGKYEPRQRA